MPPPLFWALYSIASTILFRNFEPGWSPLSLFGASRRPPQNAEPPDPPGAASGSPPKCVSSSKKPTQPPCGSNGSSISGSRAGSSSSGKLSSSQTRLSREPLPQLEPSGVLQPVASVSCRLPAGTDRTPAVTSVSARASCSPARTVRAFATSCRLQRQLAVFLRDLRDLRAMLSDSAAKTRPPNAER
jgi:hypothetical protein